MSKLFKGRTLLYIFIGLILIAFVLGSFFDLQISQTLAIRNNIFAHIMACFSSVPTYGGLAFCSGALVRYAFKWTKSKWRIIFAIVIAVIGVTAGIYFQGDDFTSSNGVGAFWDEAEYFLPLFGMVLTVPFFFIGLFIAKNNSEKTLMTTIFAIIGILVLCNILCRVGKELVHRPRFRYLAGYIDSTEHFDLYRNWWEPLTNYKDYVVGNVTSGEFTSFPSLHSCSSLGLMVILYFLPRFNDKIKLNQCWLVLIGFLWGVFTAYCRISCGAHFLTDVSFSALFITVILLLSDYFHSYLIIKIGKKGEQ